MNNDKILELAELSGSTHKASLGVYQFYIDELVDFVQNILKTDREETCLSPLDCSNMQCVSKISPVSDQPLIYRLRKRAEIRRQIPNRTSVQENKPDKIADLLEEAANEIEFLRKKLLSL